MSNKKLGRGLDYLFEQNGIDMEVDESKIIEIPVDEIRPNPFQPRKTFDESKLEELASSIKEHGVFQPILVRQGIINYEIISGERRYRASKLAGLKTIPAIVYDLNDNQMMEIGIVENIQREDLSPMEEAAAYKGMIDKLGMTQEEVAQKVGKSRPYVANKIRLLNLDEEILEALEHGRISESHARRLVSIDNKEDRIKTLHEIIKGEMNVHELEEKTKGKTKQTSFVSDVQLENVRLEKFARETLKTKVKIKGERSGKIEIHYNSRANLEEILEKLNLIDKY